MNAWEPALYAQHANRTASGPALLFIHGAGGSHSVWPAELRNLPDVHTIALDLPGHGRSPQPGRRTISHYARAVTDFIRQSNLHHVIVAGHSMGGAIALELAKRPLPGLQGFILLASSGRLRVNPALFAALSDEYPQAIQTISQLSYAEDAPETLRQTNIAELRRCGALSTTGDLLACNRFDLTAELPTIAGPALVISGTADRMVPHRYSAATAAALPRATLTTIEGAGHFVMQEAPDQVAGRLADFIQGLT